MQRMRLFYFLHLHLSGKLVWLCKLRESHRGPPRKNSVATGLLTYGRNPDQGEFYLMTRKSLFLYAVYSILTFILLVFLLFPGEDVGEFAARRLSDIFPGYDFEIKEVSPVLPLGVRAENSKIVFPDGSTLDLDSASLFSQFFFPLQGRKSG